jgi:hypothetical protein
MAHIKVTGICYQAMPQLRRLVIGFSPQRARFHPRVAYVESVVQKVALEQVFLSSIILLLLHIHSLVI